MVHLNELQETYGERGLSIVGVAKQDRSSIATFVEELEVAYPTVNEKSDSMRAYGRTSFPSAFLIDTGGRVVWSGHPGNLSNGDIERTLEASRILPAWPDALRDVRRAFDKEKFTDALAKLDKHIASDRLDEDALEAAKGIRSWIVWFAESNLEGAARDLEAGKFYEAATTLEYVADTYRKHAHGEDAAAKLKELLGDKDAKLEVKAGEKLAKILADLDELSAKKALKALRPLLGRKYEATAAGREAAALAEQLEAELD